MIESAPWYGPKYERCGVFAANDDVEFVLVCLKFPLNQIVPIVRIPVVLPPSNHALSDTYRLVPVLLSMRIVPD